MRKGLLVILLASLFVKYATAQNSSFSLKSNLISWAMLEPNLQLEYGFAKHLSVTLGGGYGWWGFGGRQNALQNWNIGGSINYYFCKESPFTKHHIGIIGKGGQFDIKWGKTGKRGEFMTAGFLYGYVWQIRSSLFIDTSLAVGYVHSDYTKYQWNSQSDCFLRLDNVIKNVPGLVQLDVSFIYRF